VHGNALQIAACGFDQIWRDLISLTRHAREQSAVFSVFAEPFSDLMSDRTAEVGMIEDRGRQRGAKQRIAGDGVFGLAANGEPKLVDILFRGFLTDFWCHN